MTKEQIELAAKIMKIASLASNSMLDTVAIKLNCNPNYNELDVARRWNRVFYLARQGGNPFDLAAQYVDQPYE